MAEFTTYTKRAKFPVLAAFLIFLITGCVTNHQYVMQDTVSLPDKAGLQYVVKPPDAISLQDAHSPDIEDLSESDGNMNTILEAEKKPMIALTFDDGPSEFTKTIVDILEQNGVRATFFILGEKAEYLQNIILYAFKNGNEIASHTWSHVPLTGLSNKEIKESIQATNAVIEKITGIPPLSFYRPPYGLVNQRVANASAEVGYSIVGWTVDPEEWKHQNINLIYNHIMDYAEENSIILLHDIFAVMPSVVKLVIPALISKGYQLVTISELLHHVYGELKPGIMYGNPGIVR